ncbi:PREDICTED: POPTR_0002s07700g [Prunus dulcis]|uniref:PREDICTED: POPTR_0002s07700g n=1 Tax=Prunus dulcis TaxID=3755 RepID=A0A5E4EC43_PRUDU|nr:PREDICTED: POPTR_0002s07700g [Prunus dulcis]
MVAKLQNTGEGVKVIADKPKAEANYWFKPKKGSVFPAKSKLVKTMVFDSIVKWVASVFYSALPPPPPSGAPANLPNINKLPNSKKCKQISPVSGGN